MANPPSPAGRLLSRLGLALASLIAGLFLLEAFLRLFAPVHYREPVEPRKKDAWRTQVHRASTVPGLTYELAPGVDADTERGHVRTNAFGMRDRERTQAKPPGTVRVAVVGDSFTFGFGVAADEAYPAILEQCLNSGSKNPEAPSEIPRFEVLNFGVGGYSSRDEAAQVREKVAAFSPDLLLVGYVLNDPEIDPVQPLHAAFTPPAWWQRWHLLRLVARAADSRAVKRLGGGNYTRYLHREPRKWASVETAFDDMAATAKAHGFATAVAIFPLIPSQQWRSYPYADLHAQVAAMAEARGFFVVDVLPALAGTPPAKLWVQPEDRHPNALGHRLAAQAICDKIRARFPDLFAAEASPPPPRSP